MLTPEKELILVLRTVM